MLTQPITFAEGSLLFTNPFPAYALFPCVLYLVGASISTYREIRSYRRQEKRWIWYKRPSAIQVLGAFIAAIALFLITAAIDPASGIDLTHLPPSSVGLRVFIAMIGCSIALIGGVPLALYRQSLIEKEPYREGEKRRTISRFKEIRWLSKLRQTHHMRSFTWICTGADLEEALLMEAHLEDINFSGANLQSANLSAATLCRANMRGADLREAKLFATDLRQTDLSGANLEGVLFSSESAGKYAQKHAFRPDAFKGACLRGANLKNVDLSLFDLSETDLSGAILDGCKF